MSRPSEAVRRFLSCRTPGALRRLRDAGDEGFTLIELVIVLVILPLVMGAIAVAIFVTLQDQSGISTKISDSVDSQVTATYFVRDVESALYVTTDRTTPPPPSPWPPTAGPAVCGRGTSLLVSFAWPSTTDIQKYATVVSYWRTQFATGTASTQGDTLTATSALFSSSEVGKAVAQAHTVAGTVIPAGTTIRSVSATHKSVTLSNPVATGNRVQFVVQPELTRFLCKTLPTPSTGGARKQTISSTTSTDFLSPFTSAQLSCVSSHPTCATTANRGWMQAQMTQAVTLAITEPSGKYDYNLTGAPRVTNTAGGLGPSSISPCGKTCSLPALLALGGGGVIQEQSCGNGATATAITVLGSAVLNTGYFTIKNCGKFSATKIVATQTPCTVPTASCPPGSILRPPNPWTVPHALVPDPLASMTDPPAEPVQPCPTGSATISPGQYKHCSGVTGAVTISGAGKKLKLEPGIYEFDTGITVGGNATLEMATRNPGTGVVIYLPCNVHRGGNHVDSWATRCTETFHDNGVVQLRRTLTGPYAGLWFWQNKGDVSTWVAVGQGSLLVTGILYAPGAPVTVRGDQVTSNTPIGAIAAKKFIAVDSTIYIKGF
ncbi:MAG: prepilin-type N-terminal cleavage/methylation domain-containing protein [Actinomycetota bacterium]|nr:prepilin-type N-terminal cleavage/methylation domain-containing protein [Actinomycetota bacterium]